MEIKSRLSQLFHFQLLKTQEKAQLCFCSFQGCKGRGCHCLQPMTQVIPGPISAAADALEAVWHPLQAETAEEVCRGIAFPD